MHINGSIDHIECENAANVFFSSFFFNFFNIAQEFG